MRRARRLILCVACITSIALFVLLPLHWLRIVPPLGIGRGNATTGRAYSVELNEMIVLRTASRFKPAPRGSYTYEVQTLAYSGGMGIHYHRWNMTAGAGPPAPVLGSFAEVQINLVWPLVISLTAAWFCVRLLVRERRAARRHDHHCHHCGYDLRATPERCPECGNTAVTRQASAAPLARHHRT